MTIRVHLWSYFRDLAGVAELTVDVAEGATVGDLLAAVYRLHPALQPWRGSTLMAVGVEYQTPEHVLRVGEEVSLFPPVQGG